MGNARPYAVTGNRRGVWWYQKRVCWRTDLTKRLVRVALGYQGGVAELFWKRQIPSFRQGVYDSEAPCSKVVTFV